MKMKVSAMMLAYSSLLALASIKPEGGARFPVKAGYWVARLAKKLEPENQSAEDRRVALIKELGERDEKTGAVSIKDQAKVQQYLKDWAAIQGEEIEVPALKIKLSLFGEVPIEAGYLIALDAFIEDDVTGATELQ